MKNKIVISLKAIPAITIISIGILAILLMLALTEYDHLTDLVYIEMFFGPAEFKILKLFLFVLFLLLLAGITFISKVRCFFALLFIDIKYAWRTLKSIDKLDKFLALFVLLFSIGCKSYLLNSMPIQHDEAYTYLWFTKPGFLTSISNYPLPNNHILNSILTNLTIYFPFDPNVNLRIPSFFFSILTSVLLFYFLMRLYNTRIALIITTLFTFLYPVLLYGQISRGYSIILFAFVICIYSSIKIMRNSCTKEKIFKHFTLISIFSIIAFYAVPSYLYAYFAIITYLFYYLIVKKKQYLLQFSISIACTVLGVVILYSPIFIVSGLKSLTNNNFVKPIERGKVLDLIPSHFLETFEFLFSIYPLLLILIFLAISVYLFYRRFRINEVYLFLYIILISPLILIAHSVIPFPRTWIYLILPFLFLLSAFLKDLKWQNLPFTINCCLVFLITGILAFNFHREIEIREKHTFQIGKLNDYLQDNAEGNILARQNLVYIFLAYLNDDMDTKFKIVKFGNFAKYEYDYLVFYEKGHFVPENYKLIKTIGENLFVYKNLKEPPNSIESNKNRLCN